MRKHVPSLFLSRIKSFPRACQTVISRREEQKNLDRDDKSNRFSSSYDVLPFSGYYTCLLHSRKFEYFPRLSGNVDIVNGNLKLILGLIWSLIVRYQIGKSKFPPRKLMLAWLKVSKCARYNCYRRGRGIVAVNQIQRYYYFTRAQSGTRVSPRTCMRILILRE